MAVFQKQVYLDISAADIGADLLGRDPRAVQADADLFLQIRAEFQIDLHFL